jgi:hypothetical protein
LESTKRQQSINLFGMKTKSFAETSIGWFFQKSRADVASLDTTTAGYRWSIIAGVLLFFIYFPSILHSYVMLSF